MEPAMHDIRCETTMDDSRDERGASLIEYALLIALIAVVCVASITAFGGSVGGSMSRSGSQIFGV
jgi:Flp pilus assembly pilin Flp